MKRLNRHQLGKKINKYCVHVLKMYNMGRINAPA